MWHPNDRESDCIKKMTGTVVEISFFMLIFVELCVILPNRGYLSEKKIADSLQLILQLIITWESIDPKLGLHLQICHSHWKLYNVFSIFELFLLLMAHRNNIEGSKMSSNQLNYHLHRWSCCLYNPQLVFPVFIIKSWVYVAHESFKEFWQNSHFE